MGGLISDLKSGRNTISVSDIVTTGEDATIVKSFTQSKVDDQNKKQGAQGVATSLGEIAGAIGHKAGEAWEMAKTKAGEAKEYMDSGKMQSDADELAQKAKDKAQEIKKGLAPKIEDAKDKLGQTASEIKENAQNIGSNIKEKGQEIKENVEPKIENMKNEAMDVSSKAERKAQEMAFETQEFAQEKTDQMAKNMEYTDKSDAIGQYLKIDIFDQDDMIIASKGEMVVEEILDEAHDNGQLDKLLANLSKEPVKP